MTSNKTREDLYKEVLEAIVQESKDEDMYDLLRQEELEKMANDLVDELVFNAFHK